MRGGWFLLIYVFLLLFVAFTGAEAFSRPWSWTPEQIRFAFLMISVAFGPLYWLVIWLRGGSEGVKAQWAARQERAREPFNGKTFAKIILIWIVVAIAVAFLFTLHRP